MSKEEIKEDIINDINRLLNKDTRENDKESISMNELFSGNMNQPKQMNKVEIQQQKPQMQPQMQPQMHPQMHPQISPQVPPQMQHMSPQMQQQMYQQQMQQQLQHQQQQQMQQQIQQQMMQQKMQQQMFNQGNGPVNLQQLPPQVQQQMQKQIKEHMEGTSFDINNIIYSNRDSLVLFLLYIILLTPQVNSLMNRIPSTSEENNYPNYIGILIRGIVFISIYIGLKKLNLL